MLKSKLMKALLVAGLISAVTVPVFAAGQAEAPALTMRDKVEKILSEDGTDRRPMPPRRGPHLTEEQCAKLDAARLAWREMSPQQQFEHRQKMHKEFLAKLPAEQREAIEKREAAARAAWKNMSEEEQQQALADMLRRPAPGMRGEFKGLHCYEGPGRHHREGRYDRQHHYDRYHHDGHCDWGDRCPFADGRD